MTGRKIYKHHLRKKFRKISHISFNNENGYIDVSQWIYLRKKLKPSLGYKKERTEHLRIADVQLEKPPLGKSFYKLLADPPNWMVQFIQKEFLFFSRDESNYGVFNEMLLKFQEVKNWEKIFLFAKYKIKNGRLYVKDYSQNHNSLKYMNGALLRLLQAVNLPDMEFVLSFHDTLNLKDIPLPVFVFCKKVRNPYIIVIPDHESIIGYDQLDQEIDKASQSYPWDEKEDIAFWRGSTTGGDYSCLSWRKYPRSKLIFAGLKYPNHINAKFSNLVLGAEKNEEFKAISGIFELSQPGQLEFIYPQDHVKYRYLIDVDGNVSTYSRFYWILRSNSTAIKQNSSYFMWFYPLLKPYVHYIPVESDFSDIYEKIEWARLHLKEAKEIAENSTSLIKKEVTTDHAYLYLYLVLKEYAKLFHTDQ